MPKYKLSVAELDINVSTNEDPDMVHTLEGMVDRRIREIISKSPRCSKSEAAILCALDYCADNINGEARTRDMEHEYVQMSRTLETLKKDYEDACAELEKLRRENAVMSDILSKAAAPGVQEAATEPAAEPTEQPEAAAAEDAATPPAATDVMFEGEHESEEKPAAKKTTRRSGRTKVTASSKSKVGDMFDMLTFKDV
jgi:cell division protein ZapA (FtsZ GTPase activity inhibitor)